MNVKEALQTLFEHRNLTKEQMSSVMMEIMTGKCSDAQIGAFLSALRMKGETVDEVAGAVSVMRGLASGVNLKDQTAVDIVGTGGDASSTFNISTTCALVTSAAGVTVAKHGNRSVSSKSGAADFLEAVGVNIDLQPEQVAHCMETVGIGFMFAQKHYSAMKYAAGPRREMGVRTIFNLLGPMCNPAGVRNQLLGVFDPRWVRPIAEVMKQLGSKHVMVVHGDSCMDEVSLSGPTQVSELKDGDIKDYLINPTDYGFTLQPLSAIQVDGVEQSMQTITDVLAGKAGPAADIVALNSGVAIYIGGEASDIAGGVEIAKQVLSEGKAAAQLQALIKVSQSC
ncbi:MAG: anthranilate phosphoribosyltransferase [Granulosicoccaceae bacterium]